MPIMDMGNIQDALAELKKCDNLRDIQQVSDLIRTYSIVAIAEQLAEANGYLAAISKRMDQVYERTSNNEEKAAAPSNVQEISCRTCEFYSAGLTICYDCNNYCFWRPKHA